MGDTQEPHVTPEESVKLGLDILPSPGIILPLVVTPVWFLATEDWRKIEESMRGKGLKKICLYACILGICVAVTYTIVCFSLYIRSKAELDGAYVVQASGGSVLYDFEYDFSQKNNRIEGYSRPNPPSPLLLLLFGKHAFGGIVYLQVEVSVEEYELLQRFDFSSMPDLQHLYLSGYGVDSRITPKLASIKKLKSLDLHSTSLTTQEIDTLKSNMPQCSIMVFPVSANE